MSRMGKGYAVENMLSFDGDVGVTVFNLSDKQCKLVDLKRIEGSRLYICEICMCGEQNNVIGDKN